MIFIANIWYKLKAISKQGLTPKEWTITITERITTFILSYLLLKVLLQFFVKIKTN